MEHDDIIKDCGCAFTSMYNDDGDWVGEDQVWCAKHAKKIWGKIKGSNGTNM